MALDKTNLEKLKKVGKEKKNMIEKMDKIAGKRETEEQWIKERKRKCARKRGMKKWREKWHGKMSGKRDRRTMATRKTIKCARKRGMKNGGIKRHRKMAGKRETGK